MPGFPCCCVRSCTACDAEPPPALTFRLAGITSFVSTVCDCTSNNNNTDFVCDFIGNCTYEFSVSTTDQCDVENVIIFLLPGRIRTQVGWGGGVAVLYTSTILSTVGVIDCDAIDFFQSVGAPDPFNFCATNNSTGRVLN